MLRALRCLTLAILLLIFLLSNASASTFEITYDKTFTVEEFNFWKEAYLQDQVFHVSEGPALLHMSLLLNTGAAPVIYHAGGSTYNFPIFGVRTLAHDFYGYAKTAVSNVTATFGTKTWDLDDIQTPDFGIGLAGLWMDAPLIDGGTADIVLDLRDMDGMCTIGWMWMTLYLVGMYQNGRADLMDYTQPYTLSGFDGVARIRAVDPVPEPAAMVLLGIGLIGLVGTRRII